MRDEGDNPATQGSWLDWFSRKAQVIFTLATAAGTAIVAIEQQRLAAAQAVIAMHSSYAAETTNYADRLMSDVDKMSFGTEGSQEATKRKSAIRIDLLDAITNATSSESGEGDRARLRHFPLWLALSSGNEEGLQLIGGGTRRADWLELANDSGDKVVRTAAMKVVRINTNGSSVTALDEIFTLSDSLNNEEILDDAIDSVDRVLRSMKRQRDSALENGNPVVSKVLVGLQAVRNSARSELTTFDAASCKAVQASAQQCPADIYLTRDKRISALLAYMGGYDNDVAVASATAPITAPAPTAASKQFEEIVQKLESDAPEVRRGARSELALGLDSTSAPILIEHLRSDSASYRLKLGVAVAFQQSDKPIVLTAADTKIFVELLGHPDATVRTNAAEFLMKVTDRTMFDVVRPILESALDSWSADTANPNLVYNSAVVLSTWVRVLPDAYSEEKPKIRAKLETIEGQMKKKGSWTHTATVIESLLSLAKA